MITAYNLRLKNFNIALPTAFHKDESLNVTGTLAQIKSLETQGFHSFLICGSTGEQHSLTLAEKIELLDALQDLDGDAERQILFGVASIRQKEAVQLAKRIADSENVTGVMLAFPPYIRPTQAEAYQYAMSIIESASKPTILYNNPLRTGFDLAVENIVALSRNPYVEGIKEAGDRQKVKALQLSLKKPFQYFMGGEMDMPEKFACGFNAVSSVMGNLFPLEVYTVLDAYLANDLQKLMAEYQKLQALITPLIAGSFLVEIKNALNQQGINMGICRSPLGNE